MTDRDELITKISRETAYIQREDITDLERERAMIRLDELRAELRKLDNPPPKVEDSRAAEAIAAIREMLGMKKG